MNHIMKRVTAVFAAIMLLLSTAMADAPVLRRDAVSRMLDGVGRATISSMPQVLRTFDDAEALPEALMADYSRAANYAIVRRMGSNTLAPDAVLTRAELMAMVGWTAEPKLEDKGSPDAIFTDLPDWSIAPISRLKAAGWLDLYMTGDLAHTDGALGADEPATQAELDYYAARLIELYNTVTPGESFYGYVNDQWMRNRELPALDIDLVHGVVSDAYHHETVVDSCNAEIKARIETLIAGIMDGSIPTEEGTATRRLKDMLDILMTHSSMLDAYKQMFEYSQAQQDRIRNVGSMAELMQVCSDIYGESAGDMLVTLKAPFDFDYTSEYIFSLRINDPTFGLAAWIDAFGLEKAKPGMVQYLRKMGNTYGISLSNEEAEALYAYCTRLWDGMLPDLLSAYTKWPKNKDIDTDIVQSAPLMPVLENHPEIDPVYVTYIAGQAPGRILPAAEVFAACPSLHLDELMQASGLDAIDTIYVNDPVLLDTAEAFFSNESNLNAAKLIAVFFFSHPFPGNATNPYLTMQQELTGYLDEAADFVIENDTAFCQLDADAEAEMDVAGNIPVDEDEAGEAGSMPVDDALYLAEAIMPEIFSEIYAENCVDEETVAVIQKMIDMIIDGYIARFERNTWMDESSKAAALDKLHTMRFFVNYPKGKLVPEITPLSEGGTFMSNLLASNRNELRRMAAACTDPDYRPLYEKTKADEVNCYYFFELNTFFILAGMIQKPYYDPDRSFAANLGAIGSVIAHEIGHAFDSRGATRNSYGAYAPWWTEKDAAIFEERKQDFIQYFNQFHVTNDAFQDGEMTLGENMADFAGMCVIMDLLEGDPEAQKEALVGMASNLAAFRDGCAKVHGDKDEHAASNVRVDAVVASLDAFYELYGITEDDPMYIAPEERLRLW